ncbi:hypothetical protein RYH80_15905 [Halobaculum sp. MBLA0147]|uniref:hypothetical protein n=1 Tax=Halobaculum sp. MBLA0147 TaxID=3079934 RepID=UPI003524AD58
MRHVLAVARTDLRRRLRTPRTLAVLSGAVLVGLVAGVDGFELVYRGVDGPPHYTPRPTAAAVALETALAGTYATVLLGYFLLRGTLTVAHRVGVDRVTASTPLSAASYLVGKWLSHVVIVTLALTVLGLTAVVNHVRHGVGSPDPLGTVVVVLSFGLPVGALVAGVTLAFESTDRLSGTLGSIVYLGLVLATFVTGLSTYGGDPSTVPTVVAATDLYGTVAAAQATTDALATVAPAYGGGTPGFFTSFLGSPVGATRTFDYGAGSPVWWVGPGDGALPAWFAGQRLAVTAVGLVVTLCAAAPHDRWARVSEEPSRLRTLGRRLQTLATRFRVSLWTYAVPSGLGGSSTTASETDDPASRALSEIASTPVERRGAAPLGRLFWQELRGKLRGRRWWWYVGVVATVVVAAVASPPRRQFVALATAWPVFVWSSLGVRATHRDRAALVHSSSAAYRQLFAEWAVGVVLACVVAGPAILADGVTPATLLATASVAVFAPSTALALGVTTGSRRVFEAGYLCLWYVGPLNVPALDFAGATPTALAAGTPATFLAIGGLAFVAAVLAKRRHVH